MLSKMNLALSLSMCFVISAVAMPATFPASFQSFNFGYASAIAYTLAMIAVVLSLLNIWLGRKQA